MSDLPIFDNTQAITEGWVISEVHGASSHIPFQLQKLDEGDVFADDEQAWAHVVGQNDAGSAYHQGALEFLKTNSPEEYADIIRCSRLAPVEVTP